MRGNTVNLLKIFTLALAQAHLTYLVVESQVSLRTLHRLPWSWTKELLKCPVCTGFWLSLGLSLLSFSSVSDLVVTSLSTGFLGSVLYEAKARVLPCTKCRNSVNPSQWKVS